MYRKKDLIIIVLLVFLVVLAVGFFMSNRQRLKIGQTNAIFDNNTGKIFVSLPEGSPTAQKISFNFSFKNSNVFIKRLSSGNIIYDDPQIEKLESGKTYDFKNFISHFKLIIKSGQGDLEYDLWVTTGDIPVLVIESEGEIANEPKTDCTINILSKQRVYNISGIPSEIELTNLKDNIQKRSFSLNVKENRITGDIPQILDFESSKRFSISALNYDRSLIRQKLAYDIFKSFSENNIAPDSRFVELYLNGEYKGVYLLARRVDRNMFLIENYDKEDEQHSVIYEASNQKADFTMGTEGFSQIEPDFIDDDAYLDPLEDLIHLIIHTDKEEFLAKVDDMVDMDNLIDNHILFLLSGSNNELASNQYLYCGNASEDKFKFCPGNYYISGFGRDIHSGKLNASDIFYGTRLYNRLYEDEAYIERLRIRWNYLRKDIITLENINDIIDENALLLQEAQIRNFNVWPIISANYEDNYKFNDDIDYIKEFVKERIEWLDSYINYPPLIKIGDTYAFINEKNNIIFCSLPENSEPIQTITWEFDDKTEIFIEPLSFGNYRNFKNNFEEYEDLVYRGQNIDNITLFIDSPEEFDYLENKTRDRLKIRGWALNPDSKGSTGVEEILIFDGPKKEKSNFLGAVNYGRQRNDVAEYFSNQSYKYSGFDFEIDSYCLENGLHKLYIYAYDNNGNYAVKTIQVKIYNKNQVIKLENHEAVKLSNGKNYDFGEFIFNGYMTIKNGNNKKQYDFFLITGNTPLVLINPGNQDIPVTGRINADMKIIYNDPDEKNFINRVVFDFEDKIGIRIRGQSTKGFPKKQYSVEIRDENDEDKNVSLLGLPSESDWVLSAPYSDKSLIRMALAFELSNQMGLYAPRTKFVEVFLDKSSSGLISHDYIGTYVLTERIKRNKNRVDIEKLDSDDEDLISGGYILEMTTPGLSYSYESYIETSRGQQYINKYPKWGRITEKQKTWITNYMNAFEDALYGENFTDKEEGCLKYIDIDSFINYIIINELFKNRDVFGKSTFISKDRNGKLKLGPIWDFDLSSGNVYENPDTRQNLPEAFEVPNEWLCERLFLDPYFVNKYIERWKELREDALSNVNIKNTINTMVVELSECQKRNFERWQILGKGIYPNPPPYAETHEEEIEKLENYFLKRVEWIDNNIDWLLTFPPEIFES